MAGIIARLFASLGLDATRQAALFRVRAKLTLRQFTRQQGRIVGFIVMLVVFTPLVLGAAFGSALGYLRLPQPWPAQLLGMVLVVLWAIWIVLPVLAFRLNEGLDLTRLLVYPLRIRDLVASTLLGTLLDFPTYLVLPLFVAVFVGWGRTWAWPVVLVGLLLGYAHMVIMSQLVLTAGGGLLRSRRFRDISIVILSLLGSSCYFLNQGIQALARRVDRQQLLNFHPLDYVQWLPTGAIARAIEQATNGAWGAALLWLLYSLVLLVGIIWLWWQLLLRLVTGAGFISTPQRERPAAQPLPRRAPVSTGKAVSLWRWLPDGVHQIFLKELRAIWRIPQRRIGLIQGVLMPVLLSVFIFFGRQRPTFLLSPWFGLGLAGYAVFTTWFTTINMLGWEGKALPMLLVTPLPRHQIFLGKALAMLLVLALPITVFALVLAFLLQSWFSLAGWLAAIGASLATMAVTTVASVLFPAPINLESTSRQSGFSGGCLTALGNIFVVPLAIALICSPLVALFVAAFWWEQDWLVAVGVVVVLLYGAGVFGLGVYLAERLMVQREAEIIAATRQPDMG